MENGNIFVAFQDQNNSKYGTFIIVDKLGNIIVQKKVFYTAEIKYTSCTTLENGNIFVTYGNTSNYAYFIVVSPDGEIIIEEKSFREGYVVSEPAAVSLEGESGGIIYEASESTNRYDIFQTINLAELDKLVVNNTLNGIQIDTLLGNGFYELLYDDGYIAKEVRT